MAHRSAGDQVPATAQDHFQPLEAEAEQCPVVPFEPAALRLVQPVGAQQPVLVCIGAKPIDVIADQEGDLLPRAGFALAGPGVGGEKGVEFGPEIVIQVVFA